VSAIVLDDCKTFIRRFVVLTDDQADAATLWVAHTHVFEAFSCTPYWWVTSAEKRSGKTRLLEVLELLVRDPLPTANISDAALFRVIHERRPSLLIDEVDAIFGKKSQRDELRGIINAGYRRGAMTHRMGGTNNTTLQMFNVFCPKAFAGIGDALPDTVADRAITVRLKRRTRDKTVERFRLREVEPEGHTLRDRLAEWLEPLFDYLVESRPALPDELDDRAQDVWEPLLAIADLDEGWSVRARAAAVALSTGEEREDDSLTAQLIRDVSIVFAEHDDKPLQTSVLLEGLYRIEESPWGDYFGKPLNAHSLSRLLKPYRVRTMPVYVEGKTVRGYKVDQFKDAFAQLSVRSVRSVRSEARSQAAPNASNAPNASTPEEGAQIVLGDPLPDEVEILPSVDRLSDRCTVAREPEGDACVLDLLECLVCGSGFEFDEKRPERLRCSGCVEGVAA